MAEAIAVLFKVSIPKHPTTKALLQAHNISYNPTTSLREYLVMRFVTTKIPVVNQVQKVNG
jgi:hypothetical protein